MSAQSSAVKTCIHNRSTIYIQEPNVIAVSLKSFYDVYDNLFFRLFIYQQNRTYKVHKKVIKLLTSANIIIMH